jgi:integrase/recombinase XerC
MPDNINEWLHWMRLSGLSPETIDSRRRTLARLRDALPVPLNHATPDMLYAWRASLTVADRAIVQYASQVRCYYAWALDAGHIPADPARKIPVPRTGRLLPRPVSDADLASALANAPRVIRLWLVLAAWCGLRAKELALLRRECILDTARRPVLIIAADATKGHDERVIPLCSFVLAELARYGLPATGLVFPRADGRPGPNRPGRVSQKCGRYLRACGIRATLHMFRHWFGTSTHHACHDLRLVQELLGHRNPSTTAGYADYDRIEAAAAVEALPVPARLRRAG